MSDLLSTQLSTASQNILQILAILLAIGMAIFCITKRSDKLETILMFTVVIFLIVYMGIFELWVFGTGTFWPYGFFPGPHNKLEPIIRGFPFYNTLYFIFSTISTSLLIFSIISLVNVVQRRVVTEKKWVKNRLRIPIVNMWYIALEMFRLLKSSRIYQALVVPWFACAALWLYYKFFAGGVLKFGFDSYQIWDFKFFRSAFQLRLGEMAKTLSPQVDITSTINYYQYLSNVLVSCITFLAGLFTGGLVYGLRRTD